MGTPDANQLVMIRMCAGTVLFAILAVLLCR
jgi:hypothetical protein